MLPIKKLNKSTFDKQNGNCSLQAIRLKNHQVFCKGICELIYIPYISRQGIIAIRLFVVESLSPETVEKWHGPFLELSQNKYYNCDGIQK